LLGTVPDEELAARIGRTARAVRLIEDAPGHPHGGGPAPPGTPGERTGGNRSVCTIGQRLFTDGVTRPVYEDDRGQFIEEDGERVDGVWLVPEEDQADTPITVDGSEGYDDGR
jgi:hypothetical protein